MNLDQITDDRLATIKEIANRKPQIEPVKPFPINGFYAVASLILFIITKGVPYHKEIWFTLSGFGLIVGVVLLAKKFNKDIKKMDRMESEMD